jgi:ABC-2 type transport system permease protein
VRELNAVVTIAYRDVMKLVRDVPRLLATFVFPLAFIAILGGSLQANLGESAGYNFLAFTFTGVFAQTLFQSSTFGVISLIEDRQTDFSQEIFVSPISRYSIVLGKIIGESLVALVQGLGILLFGVFLGIQISLGQVAALVPVAIAICLLGGTFGILLLANIGSQRAANQVFPFIILPQFFLAGVFNPIQVLPLPLEILSRISPLRYAVDLTRGIFYLGEPDYAKVVLAPASFNLAIIAALFGVFLVVGTYLFVRAERNR